MLGTSWNLFFPNYKYGWVIISWLVGLRTLVPKYICSKLQIMLCHYFLVSCCRYFQHKYIFWKTYPQPWRAHKNYPIYIHPPTVGIIYLITKNFPKLLAAYFHYFRNVYSQTLPTNSPTIILSDEYPTPTYIFNLHILPKLFAAYIQHKDIFKIYIFTNHAPEGHTETNQLTFIPPTVGMIYPIPTYIFNGHIFPKLLAAYIQYKYIFQQHCGRRVHRNSNKIPNFRHFLTPPML